MVLLRRTARLYKQLPIVQWEVLDSETALGDWYVTRVVVHRKPLLLLVCSKALLPIVTPARDVAGLPRSLTGLVAARLSGLGIPGAVVDSEIAAMEPVIVQNTVDPSILGILTDF